MKTLGGVAGINKAIDLRETERSREDLHREDNKFRSLDFIKEKKNIHTTVIMLCPLTTASIIKVYCKFSF